MSALEDFPRIAPFLWFDDNAEAAVDFYVSVFKNARRLDVRDDAPKSPALTIPFELEGQKFTALNGGPLFRFNEAISFVVRCDSQQEVDFYCENLSVRGSEGRCGWLKDQFGVSWQIVPARLSSLLQHPNALQAMLKMNKLDIAALEAAARE